MGLQVWLPKWYKNIFAAFLFLLVFLYQDCNLEIKRLDYNTLRIIINLLKRTMMQIIAPNIKRGFWYNRYNLKDRITMIKKFWHETVNMKYTFTFDFHCYHINSYKHFFVWIQVRFFPYVIVLTMNYFVVRLHCLKCTIP